MPAICAQRLPDGVTRRALGYLSRRFIPPPVISVAASGHGAFLGTLNGIAWASATNGMVSAFGLQHGIPDPRSASLLLEGNSLCVGTEAGLGEFTWDWCF